MNIDIGSKALNSRASCQAVPRPTSRVPGRRQAVQCPPPAALPAHPARGRTIAAGFVDRKTASVALLALKDVAPARAIAQL